MNGANNAPARTSHPHNDIFEKFVDPDAEDGVLTVAGMVAYGLYKKDKRQWMIRFRSERGRAPTGDEVADYTLGWNETRLENSRNTAQGVLANFAAYVLDKEKPRIIRDAVRGRLWEAIAYGLLVNALYTALLLVIVAGLGAQGVDLIDLYRDLAPSAPREAHP